MRVGETNTLSVELTEKWNFREYLRRYTRTMAEQEPQVPQTSGSEPGNPPPAKMIRLENLEQTVLGLVKKGFEQASQPAGDQGGYPGHSDSQSAVGH